jgi:uncharacterized Tic20 family protein
MKLPTMTQQNTFLGTEEPVSVEPTSEEKTLAILAHALCIIAGFLAPLVIYLIKKDSSSYVTAHAKEAFNFQLTMTIAYFVSFILMFVIIGVFLMVLLGIANLVLIIVATIKASENKLYKYPFSIKFIK